jgi:hypothetical protein
MSEETFRTERGGTPIWWRALLEGTERTGQPKIIARKLGVNWSTVKYWKSKEGFKEEFQEAMIYAVAMMELECRRRALDGVEEPVIYQGKLQYRNKADGELELDENGKPILTTIRKYSDRMLLEYLRAYHPKWRASKKFEEGIEEAKTEVMNQDQIDTLRNELKAKFKKAELPVDEMTN